MVDYKIYVKEGILTISSNVNFIKFDILHFVHFIGHIYWVITLPDE